MSKPSGVTVQELIDQLSMMDPEAHVCFAYNYGDYWRTTVAAEVNSAKEGKVKYSEYHRMHAVDDGEDDGDETYSVVILQ